MSEHEFYKDGDADIPAQLVDGNGRVALQMCKKCRCAEIELVEPCATITQLRAEVERLTSHIDTLDTEWSDNEYEKIQLEEDFARVKARAEAAEAALAKMREALRPFAEHDAFHAPDNWAVTQIDDGSPDPIPGVTAGDFRRAKTAYASLTEGEVE